MRSKLGDDIVDMIEYHIQMDLIKARAHANQSMLLVSLRECITATTGCFNHPVDASMFVWSWVAIFGK